MARETILVTGGLGYIGSHFARYAHEQGRRVIILDRQHAAPWLYRGMQVIRDDILADPALETVLREQGVRTVVHFAGRIRVDESVRHPELYFRSNVTEGLELLESVRRSGVENFVFSSSAAVYGAPVIQPISEHAPKRPVNPYGATKLAFEHALASWSNAYGFKWAALRYFNAAGAHPDGSMRENHEPETHLIPNIVDAVLRKREKLFVWGAGTDIRDFIHVQDLAAAHLLAIECLERGEPLGAVNLGSGKGTSVSEIIDLTQKHFGHVPRERLSAREGDPPALIADITRAFHRLQWSPTRSDMLTILEDTFRSRI